MKITRRSKQDEARRTAKGSRRIGRRRERISSASLRMREELPKRATRRHHKKAVVGIWLPRRVGTTAQLAVTYPCGTPTGIGPAGIVIGHDRLADGLFCFDPFAAYTAGLVTNPNMFIMGRPGTGKSTTVKLLLSRAATVLDRELVIVDPKGEYTALADHLGLEHIRLAPGGTVQINPLHIPDGLDPATTGLIASRRVGILTGMAAELLGRPVRPLERAALDWTLTAMDSGDSAATIDGVCAGGPTIDGVCALLRAPTADMCDEANMSDQELTTALSDLRLALTRLVTGDLAGMFNAAVPRPEASALTDFADEPSGSGRTSTPSGPGMREEGWASHRGIVIDLSAVIGDDTAIRLAMIATVGWLNNTTATSTSTVSSGGTGPRARIQVIDEAWRLLSSVEGVRYLQSCWKLGRTFGTANVFVTHTIADLGAQGDTDSTATKIALTLLSDSATRVTLAQSDDALTATQTALGLTDTETDLVGRLEQGVAYWQVGQHRTIVETIPTPHELAMIDTDQNMRSLLAAGATETTTPPSSWPAEVERSAPGPAKSTATWAPNLGDQKLALAGVGQ